MFKRFAQIFATFCLALLLPLAGFNSSQAQAAPIDPDTAPVAYQDDIDAVQVITPEMLQQAYLELSASDLPRVQNFDGSVSFQLTETFTLTLPSSPVDSRGNYLASDPGTSPLGQEQVNGQAVSDDQADPLIRGGLRKGGFWLEFSRAEQKMLLSGGKWALRAAICAIPGVGPVACVVVNVLLTGVSSYLKKTKVCAGDLHVDFAWWGKIDRAYCKR